MDNFLTLLHPKIVHFPIALFLTASGFEITGLIVRKDSLRQTAWFLYVFATLLTPLVVGTGLWEQDRLHLNHPILDQHKIFALFTMGVSLVTLPLLWFVKKKFLKYFHAFFVIILIAISGLVILTAHNGGRMVYEYSVGVEQ